jgi:uncharacterized protein (DUF58 family)
MPTARGWLTVGMGAVMWAVGIGFGAGALQQLGFALVALVGIAVVVVRVGGHDVEVTRAVTPTRARAGAPVTIRLELHNRGHRPAPLVLVEDRLPPRLRTSARFALYGVESEGSRRAEVVVRPPRRGRYEIGPLSLSFVDPFGLARVAMEEASLTELLVQPRVETLSLPPDPGDRSSVTSSALRHPSGARGEDFYTLREYAEGDDLRKIHWPSTAKLDAIMIRQEETPWHTRATVLLDDRAIAHAGTGDASSFERAVEAAASVVDLYHRSGYGYRVLGVGQADVGSARGGDHYNRCLDILAGIEQQGTSTEDGLAVRLAELEEAGGPEAVLVVVAGTLSPMDAAALSRCRRRFRHVTVVSFPAHRFGTSTTKSRWEGEGRALEVLRLLERAQIRTLTLGSDEPLTPLWSTGRGARSHRRWARKPELV